MHAQSTFCPKIFASNDERSLAASRQGVIGYKYGETEAQRPPEVTKPVEKREVHSSSMFS